MSKKRSNIVVDNNIGSIERYYPDAKNIFAIQTLSELMLLNCEKILLFDFSRVNRNWEMMLINNSKKQKLRQSTTAKELLAINNMLFQINRDCIVNLNYLSTIENKTLRCLFFPPHDQIERKVSKRYFKNIRQRLEII